MDRDIKNIVEHNETSEKVIERYLVKQVKALGGICLKYHSPWLTGYPDRVCLLPYGKTLWVELKSTGKKPTKEQSLRHRQMDAIGHVVYVCDSKHKVDDMLRDLGYEI